MTSSTVQGPVILQTRILQQAIIAAGVFSFE